MDILTLWLRSLLSTFCVGLKQLVACSLQPAAEFRAVFRIPAPGSRLQAPGFSRGFSLIELMVVTGIFMILSAVVLSANARFGNLVVLQGLSHEIALSIREAQVYGIAVRRFSGADFDVAYGMHFQLPAQDTASTYELFGDLSGDGLYDPDEGETVESTTIGGGYYIEELWVRESEGGISSSVNELAVVFRRPEPDACSSAGDTPTFSNNKCTLSPYNQARIVLTSRNGIRVQVIVESSGQISIESL